MRIASRGVRRTLLLTTLALLATATRSAAQSETTEYYGTDAVGSVRIVFNASGTVLGRQDYDPFGREILSAWGFSPERFGGETSDSEVQQAYFHARQFQNRTGRFGSVDPVFDAVSEPQRWNRYSYALNNPLTFTDPSGLEAAECPWYTLDDGSVVHGDDCTSVAAKDPGGGGGSVSDMVEWLFLHTIDSFVGTEPIGGDEIVPTGHAYTPSTTVQTIGTVVVAAVAVASAGRAIASAVGSKEVGSVATKASATVAKEAYHYTFSKVLPMIEKNGLRPGSFATTNGALTPHGGTAISRPRSEQKDCATRCLVST